MPISALDFRYLSPTGRNLALLEKLRIRSELLTLLDYWNLAWTNRANLGKLEKSFRTPQTLGLMGRSLD